MTDPQLLADFDERFRADPDPWRFATSDYERRKRAATLEAIDAGEGRSVLELGAGNGVLAAALAPRAARLVAVEAVPSAAALARDRLAPFAHARVVEGLVPWSVPGGPYDLVVASEILYYLDARSYVATLAALDEWLAPGGRLVAVHYRPDGPERPRSAQAVHDDLSRSAVLEHVLDASTDDYLLDAFGRVAPGAHGEPS